MLVTHCMTRSAHKYKCAYHTANSSQWLSQNLSKSNIALNTSVGNQRLLSSVTSQYKASCKSQLKLPNPQCRIREYITPKVRYLYKIVFRIDEAVLTYQYSNKVFFTFVFRQCGKFLQGWQDMQNGKI